MTDTTDPQTAEPLRIPIAYSVRYAARGLPEVPFLYGPGVIRPSEITLTYRAAPDSQLGRVHAYVKGRLWVDGREVLMTGGYGQHYDDGLDGWPEWLAEEARLHDPDAAPSAPADRSGLLDLAAQAIRDSNGSPEALEWWRTHPQLIPAHVYAAAVLSVLPPVADRAALSDADRKFLTFALDLAADQMASRGDEFDADDEDAMERLRRVADEEQQAETQESTPEQVVRDHVTTLHLIGEQLAGVESWMWEHLANVRDAAVTEQPQCDAEFVGGGTCVKPAGHRPPGSDDPHVPATPPAVVAEPGKENSRG